MAASTIRILTVAIAFTTICRHCTAFTSIGLGRTILPPRAVLPPTQTSSSSHRTRTYAAAASTATGNLHGQGSCFLPLLQNDEDYIAPRIVQVRFVFCGCPFVWQSWLVAIWIMKPMINYRTKTIRWRSESHLMLSITIRDLYEGFTFHVRIDVCSLYSIPIHGKFKYSTRLWRWSWWLIIELKNKNN